MHAPPGGRSTAQTQTRRWLALSRPPFVVAVALLAVNDALLKQAFPGWWTGKLSDLAGVFIVAVVLGLATRRPWTADLLTGVGFVALKLSPTVAALAAPLLGGVTRTDATDLVALVALLPAHRFVAHHVEPRTDGRPWQVPLTAAAISLTVLSVSATSCSESSEGIAAFSTAGTSTYAYGAELHDGDPLATTSTTTSTSSPDLTDPADSTNSTDSKQRLEIDVYRSVDGGATWEAIEPVPVGSKPLGAPESAVEACGSDGRCFRVSQQRGGPFGAVLERTGDRDWEVATSIDAEHARRMELRQHSCDGELSGSLYRSVAVVESPRGEHVLVAMGDQGALHLAPGAEEWERVPVGYHRPSSLSGPSWMDALGWWGFGALLLTFAGLLVWLVVRWNTHRLTTVLALLMVLVGVGLVPLVWLYLAVTSSDYVTRGLVLAFGSGLFALLSVALAMVPSQRPLEPPPPPFPPAYRLPDT